MANPQWEQVEKRMDELVANGNASTALHLGEAYAAQFHPITRDGFRHREQVFFALRRIRSLNGLTLEKELEMPPVHEPGVSPLHPLNYILFRRGLLLDATPIQKSVTYSAMGKVCFAIGYAKEAEQAFLQALHIDESATAKLGLAAVYRNRMFTCAKAEQPDWWDRADELVREVLDLEPANEVALQLRTSLDADASYLTV